MIAFYCDLDNTLLYSHRRELGEDKVGVERYQGSEISFMTPKSLELLQRVCERVTFIPVTTRTPEQYNRIRLGKVLPTYALTCNGGILLQDGVWNEEWYQHSRSLIEPCIPALEHAQALLREDKNLSFEVRNLHQLFLFTKSSAPLYTQQRLRNALMGEPVEVFTLGAKIYVLPRLLTKAAAIMRLSLKLGVCYSLAAGDSRMDAGMLQAVDRAFAPQALAQEEALGGHVLLVADDQIFSEAVLRGVLNDIPE